MGGYVEISWNQPTIADHSCQKLLGFITVTAPNKLSMCLNLYCLCVILFVVVDEGSLVFLCINMYTVFAPS